MKKILLALFISGNCFAQELIVDPSFNTGGSAVEYDEVNGVIYDAELLSDGRIVIAGYFNSYNGIEINNIAILHPDGTLDTSFNPGEGPDNLVQTLEVDSNDNIYIGGFFENYNGISKYGIARLNTSGDLDSTFNVSFEFDFVPYVRDIEVLDNGQLYFAGTFLTSDGYYALSRLNSDGTTDTSFDSGFTNFDQAYDLCLGVDGSLYVTGFFQYGFLYKIKADGIFDDVFNSNINVAGLGTKVFVSVDDQIIVAGTLALSQQDFMSGNYLLLAGLNSDGSTDVDFTTYPLFSGPNERVNSISTYNNKFLVAGNIHNEDSYHPMLFLDSNGQISNTPSVGSGFIASENYSGSFSKSVYSSLVLPNNKILVGGFFDGFNGVERNSFIRIGDAESMSSDKFNDSEIYVYNNGNLIFESASEPISNIEIFDVLGRTVRDYDCLSSLVYSSDLCASGNVYLAKVTFINNKQTTIKFAY